MTLGFTIYRIILTRSRGRGSNSQSVRSNDNEFSCSVSYPVIHIGF